MKRRQGFTLMEMLVVVAIVAILAAVAIPAFSASLDSAREATCAANRRSLKGLLSAAYMTKGGDAQAAEDVYEAHGAEYTCPSGGTISYTLKNGVVTVTCSVHSGSLGNSGTIEILKKNLKALTVDADSGAKDIQNGNLAGAANLLVTSLAKEGLDLESMGAKSWHYSKSSQFFFWTPVDISTLSTGTSLPVLRYNLKTGTYTVWINQVVQSSQGDYLVLNGKSVGNGYAPSTDDSRPENQTYEKAMEHFRKAMEDYPDLPGGG